MFKTVKHVCLVVLILLALTPAWASADFSDQVQSDFKPLSGVVVMPVNGEYLIDLDATQGVVEGDLFSVVVPGERVVHPVTGKVIGTLDQVKGFLQVTKVRSGYSYARPIGKEKSFAKGDVIRRFDNVRAIFWDYSGDGQPLFTELRSALPTLSWQGYAEAQAQRPASPREPADGEPALLFVHRAGKLDVYGASLQLLHSYALSARVTAPVVSTPAPVMAAPAASIKGSQTGIVVNEPAPAETKGGIVRADKNQWQGVRTIEEISGEATGLAVNDFDGDGKLEVAVLANNSVTLERFTESGKEILATAPLAWMDKALTIDSADVDGNGLPEIYVTAVREMKPASLRLSYIAGELQVAEHGIGFFLRSVETPGGGRVLLGQGGGSRLEDFGPRVYRMQLQGQSLEAGAVYPCPADINLFGFTPFAGAEGKSLVASISAKNRLQVLSADGDTLWQSSQVYGGTQNFFRRPDFSGGPGDSMHDVKIPLRLEASPAGLVLVPSNAGKSFLEVLSSLGPGSIHAMEWDGNALREVWHTRPQEGYLADFRYADIDNDGQPELLMLMVQSSVGVFSKGKASLVVYELN